MYDHYYCRSIRINPYRSNVTHCLKDTKKPIEQYLYHHLRTKASKHRRQQIFDQEQEALEAQTPWSRHDTVRHGNSKMNSHVTPSEFELVSFVSRRVDSKAAVLMIAFHCGIS